MLAMEAIHAADFEVVDTSGLMIPPGLRRQPLGRAPLRGSSAIRLWDVNPPQRIQLV